MEGKTRLGQINRIKSKYKLKFEPVLMNNIFNNQEFKSRLEAIRSIFNKSEDLKEAAKKTILINKQAQEEKSGFGYALEEVALIMDYDIKVGPPRETFFDHLAKDLGASLCGIYLRPTYPLGLDFDFFINNPEIEEYGLTPYKAGSNKMQDQRVVIGKTSEQTIRELIEKSYVPRSILLANPILDLTCIVAMGEQTEIEELNSKIQELMNNREALANRLFKLIKEVV